MEKPQDIPGNRAAGDAYHEWKQTMLEEVVVEDAREQHFVFTLYTPPSTNAVYLDISVTSVLDTGNVIRSRIGSDANDAEFTHKLSERAPCIQRVFCGAAAGVRKSSEHLAHYAQHAFSCWAALQRFPGANRHMYSSIPMKKNNWNSQLNAAFERSGIRIVPFEYDVAGNATTCDWMLRISKPVSGLLLTTAEKHASMKEHMSYFFRKPPVKYFSRISDVFALQQSILGHSLLQRVPAENATIVVLVLNRKGTRRMVHGEGIVRALQKSRLGRHIEVVYVPNMQGSLQNQAHIMHTSDIIISPHGAQLTNLAFIRPCTVVAEIFPRGYYMNFFQPYVLAAGGISFEAYEEGRSVESDSHGVHILAERLRRRGTSILVSNVSVVRALPRFIMEFSMCTRALASTPV
eukprot:CAMPEP_0179415628 /NCGR_PEP_ID=MMETSP0799-20121207/6336_1 /TAXON_ID=46947 /ORGANISM="Geminigera cryophila, Strain CCMP2564" /LENGTH=404 /DNA_ID=CAMNT_0021188385 /DNA_START=140 /DNA_END=1354 /DNA_ORIENTATION=+